MRDYNRMLKSVIRRMIPAIPSLTPRKLPRELTANRLNQLELGLTMPTNVATNLYAQLYSNQALPLAGRGGPRRMK